MTSCMLTELSICPCCVPGQFLYLQTSSPAKPGEMAVLTSQEIRLGHCLTFYYSMPAVGTGMLSINLTVCYSYLRSEHTDLCQLTCASLFSSINTQLHETEKKTFLVDKCLTYYNVFPTKDSVKAIVEIFKAIGRFCTISQTKQNATIPSAFSADKLTA